MPETSSNTTRIAKNTLLLYFRMLLTMGVSLYTSRVVLDVLGVEDYGIYNVVGGVVAILGFISGPMIEATQRFLNFYMGKNDSEGLNNVFNACQVIHFVVAIIVCIVAETIGLWFVYKYLVIPPERLDAAVKVFHLSVISSVFLVMSFPYNAAIIAHEKMSVFAIFSIGDSVLKLLIVYLLKIAQFDHLIFYATMLAALQILVSLAYRLYCIINFEEVKLKIKRIPKNLYRQILSFSGWNFIGNIANQCLTQGTNVILNMFFGPAVNAAKGVAVQVQHAVQQLCGNFMMAVRPQIVKSYASGDYQYMHSLILMSSRISFYLVSLISLPVIFKSDWILSIWLKQVPEYASIFLKYTMLFALIQSLSNPLLSGCIATGNVKRIMAVIATFFIMVIPASYVALWLGMSPVSVFVIQLVMYVIAHIMRVEIVCRQISLSRRQYLFDVIKPIVIVSALSVLLIYFCAIIIPDDGMYNIMFLAISAVVILTLGFFFGTKNEERKMIKSFVSKKLCSKE